MRYDFIAGGFRFRVIDSDYDYAYSKSVRYRANKHNIKRALEFIYNYSQDYVRDERDCSGSWEVRIRIKRKGAYMWVQIYENKDV